MTTPELQELCLRACEIVAQTASFIRQHVGQVQETAIEEKSRNSLVSYVDKTAEEQLVTGLRPLLPTAAFLTEEETVEQREAHYRWIIDPLDGTTNFLHQLPHFSISVALQAGGETILGIVYEVNRQECFYAWKGGGAFLNDHPIRTRPITQFADSLISTGFPYYDYEREEQFLRLLQYFTHHTRGIRRFGSAALDLAYVACGRYDLYFEYSLNAWDVAAGAFLVQEAGGRVSDFTGGDNYLFGREILATAPGLFEEGLHLISKGFATEKED